MKVLVVGLGNIGKRYEHTPHNIGFEVVDALAGRSGCALKRSFRYKAQIGKIAIADIEVLLVKPGVFMNNSGYVVARIMKKHGITATNLIVVHDDADIETGQLRIRAKGGDAGHKGLKSIIENIGQQQFMHVRLGIGHSKNNADLVTHVLSPFDVKTSEKMKMAVCTAVDAVLAIVKNGIDAAMNQFNGAPRAGPWLSA